MLELKHITYTVSTPEGEQTILNDISIDIPDRKLIVFTGPNGGGKTTLAKVIMGLVTPTGGQILFNGQDITHLGITERARLGISYGFQQPPRFKGIRVSDLLNVAAGKNLGHDEACSYLTKVGLCARDYLSRDVDTSLSGGEVKRIEIATILAKNASLMLFDEPEAGIDLWSFQNLISVFERMRQVRSDRTILVISHQERILNMADEIIVLAEGKIVSHGSRAEILPTLLGTPSAVSACAQLEKTTGKEGNC